VRPARTKKCDMLGLKDDTALEIILNRTHSYSLIRESWRKTVFISERGECDEEEAVEAGLAGLVAAAFPAMHQNVMHGKGASERLAVFREWLLESWNEEMQKGDLVKK
jgi:hypothetical protein